MNSTMALSGEKFVISKFKDLGSNAGRQEEEEGADLIKLRQKQRDKDHFIHCVTIEIY